MLLESEKEWRRKKIALDKILIKEFCLGRKFPIVLQSESFCLQRPRLRCTGLGGVLLEKEIDEARAHGGTGRKMIKVIPKAYRRLIQTKDLGRMLFDVRLEVKSEGPLACGRRNSHDASCCGLLRGEES